MTYSFPLRVNNLLVWSIWLEFNDMPSGFVSTPTPAPRNPSLSPTWRTDSSNIIYIIYIQAMHKISALTVTSSLKKPTVSWLILYSSSQTNMNISVHFSSSFSSSARTKPICFSWRTQCWKNSMRLKLFQKARIFVLFRSWNLHEISCGSSRIVFSYISGFEYFTSERNKGFVSQEKMKKIKTITTQKYLKKHLHRLGSSTSDSVSMSDYM